MDGGDQAQRVEIRGEVIRLGQLLKLAGVVASGAEAKDLLASDQVVLVNGERERRRGRQLHPGDTVRTADRRFSVRRA